MTEEYKQNMENQLGNEAETLANIETCNGDPEICDLHTSFCNHKNKEEKDHNTHCFTHETCWFDPELEAYWKKEEENQCDICEKNEYHCFGGDLDCNCDCDMETTLAMRCEDDYP